MGPEKTDGSAFESQVNDLFQIEPDEERDEESEEESEEEKDVEGQ